MKLRMETIFPAVLMFLAAGCAGTEGRRAGEHPAAPAVRNGVDSFLAAAMSGEYGRINALIVPSQRRGFNAEVFIEDRFRTPLGRFEIIAWDRMLIKVVNRKAGGVLSSVPVSVRMLAGNEIKPLYVNLHWRKVGGRWLIEPYPQQ